ncbi:NAD(P)-dependent dehydrogenase (short-subunit alcohol dehydrogenase family) [Catenulispora sp. MAP12-49]|uniref:hypothetical protein n=1 Tax=Catenulispora sp. MAP12-49 TaxID=3156302 RepID=UPI003517DF03
MDPAAVVVQALVTGAGAGLGGTASAAVTDGYGALKHVLARRLAGRHAALAQLEAIEDGSAGGTDALIRELVVAGAVDEQLLADARHLLALADPEGAGSGKFQLHLRDGQGMQVGDGNTQTNTFH